MIAKGSQLVISDSERNIKQRLVLNSGTRSTEELHELSKNYAPGAIVPKLPWREPSSRELELLGLKSSSHPYEWNMGSDISIVKIPEKYLVPFVSMLEDLDLREKLASSEYYVSASKHPKWGENLEAIRNHVAALSSITSSDVIYFRIAEPSRLTLTKDEFGLNERKFAGIHVDSWDRRPLRHRHRSRNRLCINLSREPRYSLFINLPLMQIFHKLGLRDPQDIFDDFRGLTLGHRFLRLCPDYPVVRMRVDPGEAYILPTDNLLHDASTEGNQYPDITLTFLGYFSAPSV